MMKKCLMKAICIFWISLVYQQVSSQSNAVNGEIFIPMDNRSEIWLKPNLDTLLNKKEYSFKIRVAPELIISQFLFEKGLAIQNDSVLLITANSTKWGDYDTATLRAIVTSITGSRIYLFQKQFIVKVPERMFPVISNPKTNLIKLNDKVLLIRNKSYPRSMFIHKQPFVTMYDNEKNMNQVAVSGVTISLTKKEGKQYISGGDTLSSDAIQELKKIKTATPVYIKVDGQIGKSKRSVWERIFVFDD
ncbi:MAG: hypothetical protein IPP77_02545 [Bacteroidetes bacterium]|nr:hypothetical protein [Bacteroidota bacterium]